MDISGISTSLNTQGSVTSWPARSEIQPLGQDRQAVEEPREQAPVARGRRGLALGILKHELRVALKAHFHARFAASAPSYIEAQNPESPDDVAGEALGAAKQLVAESPTNAAKSLIAFRARVQETATYVRETVGPNDDASEIDDVVTKVDAGLDELEGEVARFRESSASVLAVDSLSKQRSTIQIRTQEGDVVRFSLKRVDSMSASDVAYTDGEMSATATEVAVSSRSRMVMKVEGDLNESELAAIRNVFDQAEMIANEFFGGDIGAAFNVAQGFEFDTEQLARVNMRFRMRQISSVAYAASASAAPLPAPQASPLTTPEKPIVTASEVRGAPEPAPVIAPEKPIVTVPDARVAPEPYTLPVIKDPAAETQSIGQPVQADAAALLEPSSLEDFLDTLRAFLRSVGEGFGNTSGEAKVNYHYSESFKLEVLKAVLHTVAPGEVMHAANNAATVIDSIAESSADSA